MLLETRPPEQVLREWMDRLARYAMTEAGLAGAMRRATCSQCSLAGVGHGPVPRMLTAGPADRCEVAAA
ncbi:hypothetical protein [Actinacidiphila soli]|uniref:hypothetical protein n=1 Tax=Actinacidiphila soli TaxID=2487275 RepID=UPI003898EE84